MKLSMSPAEFKDYSDRQQATIDRLTKDLVDWRVRAITAERARNDLNEKLYVKNDELARETNTRKRAESDRDHWKGDYEERGRIITAERDSYVTRTRDWQKQLSDLTAERTKLQAQIKELQDSKATTDPLIESIKANYAQALKEQGAQLETAYRERLQAIGGINLSRLIDMADALAHGQKIQAIKLFREMTGYGLKESKDAIEGNYKQPAQQGTIGDLIREKLGEAAQKAPPKKRVVKKGQLDLPEEPLF